MKTDVGDTQSDKLLLADVFECTDCKTVETSDYSWSDVWSLLLLDIVSSDV